MHWVEIVVLALSTGLGVLAAPFGCRGIVAVLLGAALLTLAVLLGPAVLESSDPGHTIASGLIRWIISFGSFVAAPLLVGSLSYRVVDYLVSRREDEKVDGSGGQDE